MHLTFIMDDQIVESQNIVWLFAQSEIMLKFILSLLLNSFQTTVNEQKVK